MLDRRMGMQLFASLREESDDGKVPSSQLPEIFQSTLPRRERHYAGLKVSGGIVFQSTLPRRERRETVGLSTNRYEFQSTLP